MSWDMDFGAAQQNVAANVEIQKKGSYELVVKKVYGVAYVKDDGSKVSYIGLRPELVGKYDSKGALIKANFEGKPTEDIKLYIHTDGGQRQSKKFLMAVFGFPMNNAGEEEYNQWAKKQDWKLKFEETDDDKVHVDVVGQAWKNLEGKHFIADMEPTTYQPKDRAGQPTGDPIPQQKYVNFSRLKKAS